jgi:hypothetical protein
MWSVRKNLEGVNELKKYYEKLDKKIKNFKKWKCRKSFKKLKKIGFKALKIQKVQNLEKLKMKFHNYLKLKRKELKIISKNLKN